MSDKPPFPALSFPGADLVTKAFEQARHNAEEFSRLFTDAKLPALLDTKAVLAAHKRNIEVLTKANQIAIDGAQAVVKRNMEILQQTVAEMSETIQALSADGTPQEKAASQAALLKRSYERAIAHTRELGELIQTTNTEAASVLNKRFTEAVEEVKALVAKSTTPPA
jgi:phasin family protein